jgi:NADP-dependent 3-hydroxy acid dehydrogenase YdfG
MPAPPRCRWTSPTPPPCACRAGLLQGGTLDLVVYCAGPLPGVAGRRLVAGEMLRHQQVNYVGALHVLDAVLPALLAQGAAT